MMFRRLLTVLLVFWGLATTSVQARDGVERSTDTETGLQRWIFRRPGFELTLAQRTPDQTRAFFLARGFDRAIADEIATACVFQTIAKNLSDASDAPALTIRLSEWRVMIKGKQRPLKLKSEWAKEWRNRKASKAARLAFRWATFPDEQTFYPRGDYNWGMISFNLPPGTRFDLLLSWHERQQHRQGIIKGLVCPEDRTE